MYPALASFLDRLDHVRFVFERFLNAEIARYYEPIMLEVKVFSFSFSCAWVDVHPDLKMMA